MSTILALSILYPIENSIHRSSREVESTFAPIFSLPGGYYDRDVRLKISGRYDVVFTIDGSVPTHTAGTPYTQPILMNADTPTVTTVRARAILPDGTLGPVASASYFVGVPATLPLLSLIVDPDDFWEYERGIYINHNERGMEWERPVDITYIDQDRHSGFHISAGIRIHGGGSRSYEKKALRLYFRQEYGVNRLEYPLFDDDKGDNLNVQSFKRLILHNGGQDCTNWYRGDWGNWTLVRNHLTDNLALQIDGYAARAQPVVLFINGESWGVYQIRERLDDYFLADHYGIKTADSLNASGMFGEQSILAGDDQHWQHLLKFVESHDLTDPNNYAYVQSQVNMADLIDYNILQIYIANADWPHHNVRQFRPRVQGGRWHWLFWDSDNGFAAFPGYLHSRVDSNLIQHVLEFNHERTGGRDLLLLRKLLDTPVFFNQFLSRTADLLNTTLSPASVIAHIDALAAELEPDIAYETIRWPNSVSWTSNVEELRDFARRRPDFVRQHIIKGFYLSGTVQLTLNSPASGSGHVAINGLLVPELPWQGIYFHNVPIQLTAAPASGYRFAGWDPPSLPQTPVITLTASTTQTITPRFEQADTNAPRPGDVILSSIEKDEFELQVMRPGGVDLRGWRITDNDTKTATDEGSLIFGDSPAFTHIPQGTTIRIILSSFTEGTKGSGPDDLNIWNQQMILRTRNPNLDTETDPGFNLGPNDNLVLLAPGPSSAFSDDQGIAFVSKNTVVTPASFGVLSDGVRFSNQIAKQFNGTAVRFSSQIAATHSLGGF
ncbi:MAG: hypothetical protein GY832_44845 [Chloroflexi bacterium]|nr:hypothetical protein [Chloroflexota bacterium]